MTQEIGRRLVNGNWVTNVADESGGGGSQPLSVVTVDLTSAEIKALHATPKTLVAAPAAGHAIVPVSVTVESKFGTVAYTGGSNVVVTTALTLAGSGAHWLSITSPALKASESTLFSIAKGTLAGLGPLSAEVDGVPLVLAASSTEFATGDGTARVTVFYFDLTLL